MFTLPDIFRPGLRVFGVPMAWYRKVSMYLTNITAGTGIRITQPGEPSVSAPVKIELDPGVVAALEKIGGDSSPAAGDSASPTPDAENVDNAQTGDGGTEGIASATDTTAYVTGDTAVGQSAARVLPLDPGEGSWTAGGTKGLKQYEISRIAPFSYGEGSNPPRYAKIFSRLVTRNHSGLVVSVGDEVDQGIIIRLY